MNELILVLALGAAGLSNFPRDAGGRISQQAIGVTIGGQPALVVPAGEKVIALRGDGSMVSGFPIALGGGEAASGPAASADMDGDGRPEVAVVTTSGRLFLWSGGLVPGFPVMIGARARAGVTFGDVDGDGKPEVLVGDEKGRVHAFKRSGREAAGWPALVGAPVTSSVSASGFGGGRSLAVGCEDGKVHVLDGMGRPRVGFPLVTKFSVTGAPAFADLDDDGEMDLVVASQDFGVYAVNGRGQALKGFPVRAAYRLYEGVAIADLDGDKRLDIAFASADGMLHAVNARGEPLAGFPVRVGSRLFSGPVVGDLDRDGVLDLVTVTSDGTVTAVSATGKPLAGFPSPLNGTDVGASPLLYDATGDGTLSIFIGLPNGAFHAIRGARAGTAHAAAPWPGPGRDAARSGRYGPNPPSFKDLAFTPAAPRALDAVKARWRASWLDAGPNETAPTPRIDWLRDGKPVAALQGKKDLPSGTVKRGERWQFVLSAPGTTTTWQSPELRVQDTAPGAPTLVFEPAVPSRSGDIKANVAKPAVDPDGDPLTYEIVWLLDGLETGVQGDKFPGNLLRRGALLTARAVASDGELTGPPALVQARVGDTAPVAPQVSLEPATPGRADTLRARVDVPATDLDGDPIVYRYRWTVDGQPRNLSLSSALLPGTLFRKHQKVEVDVRAYDGQREGPAAHASVQIRNTPPTAPRVEIRPARPRKGDALRASIVAPSGDVDGDAITYRLEWRKNGAPFAGTTADGREVPGSEVARADHFELTVTPSDGEASGPKATATIGIGNTPPTPPRIAIEPARPKGGETLKLVVLEPAHDVDGEKVSIQIAWTREGKPTGTGTETLPPSQFRKHERVRVVVTPRDGEEPGNPAAHEVVVGDAQPTAPVVAFATEKPMVTAPLRVVVKTPATDPDGDAIRYQYRWIRDGAPVALPDGTEPSKAAPFWTSASEVPAKELKKGQRWLVEVRAHDGEQAGPLARATTTIVNSPPPAPRLLFAPERPRRVDGIVVAIEQPPDPDGDVLTYRYTWTRDGQKVDAPPDQAQIARGIAKKGQRWAVEVIASDGEADSPAVRHEAVIADTAPGPTAVALCDGPVPAGTVPQARISLAAFDADGDPITYRHDWFVNGTAVPAAQGQARLASPALRKHDLVRVVVTPWDGDLAGPPAHGECEVEDTPPTAPAIALEPSEPTAPRGVSVTLRKPSTDRDGDEIAYRYLWFRDGVQTPHDQAVVPPAVLRHGETWRVEVTPYDGEVTGEPASASAVVRNTPPPAPSIALVPATPVTGEPVVCDARSPERDADQEPITLRYRWYRNDQPVSIGEGGAALPTGVVRRGEKWRCEAWAFDGTAESPRASAELTVRNSPPSTPKLVVEPEVARRGDELLCRVEAPSTDLDDDPVTYTYAWTKNDRPMPPGTDPARVESAKLAKGERWRCTATPSDGAASGPSASAERTVTNSPPGPAIVRLQPVIPKPGEPIRCDFVAKSEDADGDAVRYRFTWQRNGTAQPFAESSQEVPPRLVKGGDRWRCSVSPTDGGEDGPAAGSEETQVSAEPDDQGVVLPVGVRAVERPQR
ncbi:MAG TPA: FG-GAP-like repeat-containing protein [Anaeromyxobacter sp.]